ncbi:MAG: SufD family Fe-S cluster assembly protein [Parcubacteria group bacterium]
MSAFKTTSRPKKDLLRQFPDGFPELKKIEKKVSEGIKETVECHAETGDQEIFITCAEGSQVNMVLLEKGTADQFSHVRIHGILEKDAHLHVISEVTGGARIETDVWIELKGSGASAMVSGMLYGTQEVHHGFHVVMDHIAPSTSGDIFLRGVYRDQSRGVFTGLIRVEKDAQQTNSYFKDDVLLFDDALAESLPTLEILANDVKASHGSTTGRINDEQLFYLMSRGLSKEQASEIIIQGFLEKVRERIPKETIHN